MSPARRELGALWRLAWPLVITQVGFMMLGVVDALLLGRLSVAALDAAALANMWGWATLALGNGVVNGMDPLVSQAYGDGDTEGAALALQRGLVVALCVSAPVALGWAVTGPVLVALGQDPEIAALAQKYNALRAPSVPFLLGFAAIRSWLSGRNLVAPAMWIATAANAVNALLGWALIFGKLGLPRLELTGAALVASVVAVVQLVALIAIVRLAGIHEGAWRAWDRRSIDRAGLARIFRIGFPMGLQMSFEGCAWSLAAVMAGWLGISALAGHTIVLNMIALWFQVPMGISLAASVRVGNLLGGSDLPGARLAGSVALSLGAGVMLIAATAFVLFRTELPLLFTRDAAVVELAALILPIAGAFQIFDGTQVVAGGILRGAGRTRAPALANLLGYYAFALPLALWLGSPARLGLAGIWWALLLGLVAVSSLMLFWLRRASQLPLAELRVAAT
ncbi:MAG: MATE family efflux transporter [Myxococcota bacterium]